MGMINPDTGRHEAIVEWLTAQPGPVSKKNPPIGLRLASGRVIGGEEYKVYEEKRRHVEAEYADAVNRARNAANAKMAQAHKDLVAASAPAMGKN